MDKSTAETVVKVWAILSWIGAGLSAIGAIGMLFFAGSGMMMLLPDLDEVGAETGAMGAFGIFFAVLMIGFAVLYFFVGLGLWRRQNWARITTIVLSVLSLLSFPIGTVIGALGIYFFGFEEAVKNLFR